MNKITIDKTTVINILKDKICKSFNIPDESVTRTELRYSDEFELEFGEEDEEAV